MSATTTQAVTTTAPDPRRWWALAVLVMAQFVTILDSAIVTVALPSIQADLGVSAEDLQWVITAYAIFFGGALLLGGRLADLLGRRRLFVAGIVLFTAASLFNGLAWSGTALIVGRAVQGLGAALLVPAALSLLVTSFPEGPERNRALGIWAAASAAGGSFGLLLGGALTDALSWEWIFFINIPIGAVVLGLAPVLLSESRAELTERRLDVMGAVTITSGLMLLVYGLTRAAETSWTSTEPLVCLAASLALIVVFVVIEARAAAPLLPLRMFRMRTLTASNLSGMLTGTSFVVFFLGSLYAQRVLGYSATETGAAFLAASLTIVVGSGIAQSLIGRIGVRPVVSSGFALATVGLVLLAQAPADGHYFADLFPAFVVFGFGMSLAFVGQQIGAQLGVAPADAGVASGLINTSQQVGAGIAVAVGTTIAATATASYVDAHPGTSALGDAALTHGYQVAYYVFAGVTAFAAVFTALVLESAPRRPQLAPTAGEAAEGGTA